MILPSTSSIISIVTTAAGDTEVAAAWADLASGVVTPGATVTNIATATTTTVVAAPAASTSRKIKTLSIYNNSATPQTLTVEQFDGTTASKIISMTLTIGQSVTYEDGDGWNRFDAQGRPTVIQGAAVAAARPFNVFKVGSTKEAAGVWYCASKDTGYPGAWSPGTPGLNGRATDGTAAADAGCIPLWLPTGTLYMGNVSVISTVAEAVQLADVLWVNTGLVVTTTTAQAITPVALPARDSNDSANGAGVLFGILVTTATTNAGAITNTTMSYTNQDGVAGRTATIASFPATAVVGTFVLFLLQAGDTGVRSVQSVTLGTSYAGGAISLIGYRPLTTVGVAANLGFTAAPNVKIPARACIIPFTVAAATTGSTININGSVMEL